MGIKLCGGRELHPPPINYKTLGILMVLDGFGVAHQKTLKRSKKLSVDARIWKRRGRT